MLFQVFDPLLDVLYVQPHLLLDSYVGANVSFKFDDDIFILFRGSDAAVSVSSGALVDLQVCIVQGVLAVQVVQDL